MLVGTDNCVCVVFVWEEAGVPGGNPPTRLGVHITISHTMPSIKPGRSGDRRVLFHCPSQTAKC